MIRDKHALVAWLRLNAFYGKNMPDSDNDTIFTYATSLFVDELMEDAYKVAELEYVRIPTKVPPQKVQDILRAMWDLPKYAKLREACEQKARRVFLRVPDDEPTIPVELRAKRSDGFDGAIYCNFCKGGHAPPACHACQYVFTIEPNHRNGHQCERPVGHAGTHYYTKSPAGAKCCNLCALEPIARFFLCKTCNTGRAGHDSSAVFRQWAIAHWNQGHEVIEYIGEQEVLPVELKEYIESPRQNTTAVKTGDTSHTLSERGKTIVESLANPDNPKAARDYYEKALELLDLNKIYDCIWNLTHADKLEYAKSLQGLLDSLIANGIETGQWQGPNVWGYTCSKCGVSATHMYTNDRALCASSPSNQCLVTHVRPDMKDRPK